MTFHEEPLEQVFKPEEMIYFSPDAEEEIETIDPTKVYVIGGLVDRSIVKVIPTPHSTLESILYTSSTTWRQGSETPIIALLSRMSTSKLLFVK